MEANRLFLTAGLLSAFAFTFSCSSGGGGGGDDPSSSSGTGISSSSGGGSSSSSAAIDVSSSSDGGSVLFSSSSSDSSSSSSVPSSSSAETPKCGGFEYNAATQFCQSPNVVKDLCGMATYTAAQFCQSPNVVKDLCGAATYTATQFCQSPNVAKDLCGMATYTAAQFCQSPNVVKDLCGATTYTGAQFCQSPNVIKDLCGTATYTATQFCQSPNVIKNLCGAETFTSAQGCCNSSIYTAATQFCDARDSKIYKWKLIGTQTWMAENLNYNADGSRCYGDNTGGDSQDKCGTYGRLYNWATAMGGSASSTANPSGVHGVCPGGWHLPSKEEWDALTTYVQSNKGCSNCDAKHLKATSGWNSNGNGLDSYGFSALPGGYGHSGGDFYNVGDLGFWWSSSEYNSVSAYYRYVDYLVENAYWDYYGKSSLFSVRCLRD